MKQKKSNMKKECTLCNKEATEVWLGHDVCEEHKYCPAYKLVEAGKKNEKEK